MKEIELTPKAEEDLEVIRDYSYRQFGVVQADVYIGQIAAVFDVLAINVIGTHHAELGEDICSLPVELHMIYFVSSHSAVTSIRILSQSQDTAKHKSLDKQLKTLRLLFLLKINTLIIRYNIDYVSMVIFNT